MRTTTPPPPRDGTQSRLASAAEVMKAFVRAGKARRLYPHEHTIVRTFLLELSRRLETYHRAYGDLELAVTRGALHVEGEPVHEDEHSEWDLALKLYVEGVREMILHETVLPAEIEGLLGLLSTPTRADDDMDDLGTRLWEEGYQGVTFTILQSFFDESGTAEEDFLEFVEEGEIDERDEAEIQAEREELFSVLGGAEPLELDVDGAEEDLFVLTDDDRTRLATLIDEDRERDHVVRFGEIVVEVLTHESDPDDFVEICSVAARLLDSLLDDSELLRATTIASGIVNLRARIESDARAAALLEQALRFADSDRLFDGLADALGHATPDQRHALLTLLTRRAARDPAAVCNLLEHPDVRPVAMEALRRSVDRTLLYLVTRVHDRRPAVVHAVVRLLGATGDPRALAAIGEATRHPDTHVRVEAIRAAIASGSVSVVEEALNDEDENVRLATLRALNGPGGRNELAATLIARAASRVFEVAGPVEKKELFLALGRLGGPEVHEFLEGILAKRPLFGRKRHDELRACALSALGAMRTRRAMEILDEHLEDRSQKVREAAFAALRSASTARGS